MNIEELKKIIGDQISAVLNESIKGEERKRVIENAEYVAKLSKQFINASDIQIRYKRLTIDAEKIGTSE